MDAIISEVLSTLEARESSQCVIDLNAMDSYDESMALYNKHILIVGVHYGHLRELKELSNTPWILFLYKALSYGCHIVLRIAVPLAPLIPTSIIRDWPIRFLDNSGHPLYAFKGPWIHGAVLRTCDRKSNIILSKGQKLTAAAKDIVEQLQLQVIEGNE